MNKFSQKTQSFYHAKMIQDYIDSDQLPDDAQDVSEKEEALIRAAIVRRETASNDAQGEWKFVPMLVSFQDQAVRLMADVRATREAILNRLAGFGMAALVDDATATADAITKARRALLDITEAPEVVQAMAAESISALHDAIASRYKSIEDALPADIRMAFLQVAK